MSENNTEELQSSVILTKEEQRHIDILSEMSVLCRSDYRGFTDKTRLEVIGKLLKDSEYDESYHGSLCRMYSKKPISEIGDNVILVSSHADTVFSISKCSSKLDEKTGWMRGTYDNQVTNAAAVIAMLEMELPDNVVFAFTGEEETGSMRGASEAADFLHKKGKRLFAIALDVTPDGFRDNVLNTIENCVVGGQNALNQVANAAIMLEPKDGQGFLFVKADRNNIPSDMDRTYLASTTGMCDEAYGYRDKRIPTFSFCIPCGLGNMHSDYGVAIKAPVFEGYILSLSAFLWSLQKEFPREGYVEEIKEKKGALIQRAKEIAEPEKTPLSKPIYHYTPTVFPSHSNGNLPYHNTDYDYDDYEEDDDEVENIATWRSFLRAKALEYEPDEMEQFVKDTDIPFDVLEVFCLDPEKNITKTEASIMDQYIKDVFKEAHELGFYANKKAERQGIFTKLKRTFFPNYREDEYDYDSGL